MRKQDPVQVHHNTDAAVPDRGVTYLHCAQCLEEWKREHQGEMSPKDYARQQCALTGDGIQVWCTRHECNITAMTFRAVYAEKERVH